MVKGLRGSFPMSCDSKGRITLPASLRRILGAEVVLLPFDGCAYGFTPDGFDEWVESLFVSDGKDGYNPHDEDDAKLMRRLNADAVSLDIDSAGRIALGRLDVARPGRREKLGLVGDVTVVGAGTHFEVWNTARWDALTAADDESGALENLVYHRKR